MLSSVPQAVDAFGPLASLVLGIVALEFVVGVPVLLALAIRFLWYRHVYIGRSAELEKLIWQLHRVASALEQHQASAPQAGTPEAAAQPRSVALSMFGR